MTARRAASASRRLRGESNFGTRFDSTPDLLRAMGRCVHAGNPERVARQLNLDVTTVYAWAQRHPTAHPGEHRPRLNGPAKQLAILMDGALEYVDESQGREAAEAQRDDALAPLHWLCGAFGLHAVDELTATRSESEAQAAAVLLGSVGGLVEDLFAFGVDGFDDEERGRLDGRMHAIEGRLHELRAMWSSRSERPTRLSAVRGGKA